MSSILGGGGNLAQIQYATKTDTWSTPGSAAWYDVTGLSVTITPGAVGNLLIVQASLAGGTSLTSAGLHFRLVKDGSPEGVGDPAASRLQAATAGWTADTTNDYLAASILWPDVAAAVAATTFKIQCLVHSGTGHVNRSGADANNSGSARLASSLIVIEARP